MHSRLGAFLLICSAAFGCSAVNTENFESTDETSADLVVGDNALSNDITVFPDHLEVPAASHPEMLELAPNAILAGPPSTTGAHPHDGYLRRVQSVATSNGIITIATTNAALTDAIVNGSLHTSGLDMAASNVSTSSLHILDDGTNASSSSSSSGSDSTSITQTLTNDFAGDIVLFQNESGELSSQRFNLTEQVKVAEGNVSFTPTFEHEIQIKDHALDSLTMKLGGEAKLHALLDVQVTADVDLEWDSWKGLPTKTRTHLLRLQRIGLPVEWVGALPVYETLDLGLDLGCDFTFQGPIETQIGIDIDLGAAIGAAYANGQWSNAGEAPKLAITPTFSASVSGQVTLQCYVQPSAQILFYGIAGPSLQFGPYVELDTENSPTDGFRYAVYPGFNAQMGGDFQLFQHDVAFGSFTIFQCQSPNPWLHSATLPSQDAQNAASSACSWFPNMSSGGDDDDDDSDGGT